MLNNKKILFISSKFFGYEKEIQNALIKMGAIVDFYDDRPKNTFLYKALIRINKRILKRKIEGYYDSIINKTRTKQYDYVFFLKAESISERSLKKLKETQSEAVFVLYLWDSIENRNDVKSLLKSFDRVLSFDKNDVKRYPFMHFRPLFYIEKYSKVNRDNISLDLCFIGTGHSDRYKIIKTVKNYCRNQGVSSFFFMYLQGKTMYYYRKLFSKAYRKSKMKDFSYVPLSQKEVIKIIESSKAVLDIQHDKQTGLTMRSLEILGAKKKLITTNKDIINYDFYHPNNICIIDRKNPIISKEFFDLGYVDIEKKVYEKYSINTWLKDILKKS